MLRVMVVGLGYLMLEPPMNYVARWHVQRHVDEIWECATGNEAYQNPHRGGDGAVGFMHRERHCCDLEDCQHGF